MKFLLIAMLLASQGEPYKATDEGITAPVITKRVEPKYSEEARLAKIEGSVALTLIVDREGKPTQIKVERGLDKDLDKNAVEAVSKWRFKPGERYGKPVAVSAKVEVNFKLL
jgi:protein TonB